MATDIKNKYPVVRIFWVDAEIDNSWRDEADIAQEEEGDPVITVGFLVRKPSKNFKMYMVASTIAHGNHNAIIKIPKAWIKSVEYLDIDKLGENKDEKDVGKQEPIV